MENINKEFIVCNFVNMDSRSFNLLKSDLKKLGFGISLVASKELNIQFDTNFFSGSLVRVYRLEGSVLDNFVQLLKKLDSVETIFVIGVISNNKFYSCKFILDVVKSKGSHGKEGVLMGFLLSSVVRCLTVNFVGLKLLGKVLKVEK